MWNAQHPEISLSHGVSDILLWWPESINSSLFFFFFRKKFYSTYEVNHVSIIIFFLVAKSGNLFAFAHAQLCLTLCDPMKYSQAGSSIHGIFQARILEWVAILFWGCSQTRDQTYPVSPVSPVLQEDSSPAEPLGKPNKQ